MIGSVASIPADIDADETAEWLEPFDDILSRSGPARARYLMLRLLERAGEQRVAIPALTSTDYVNTIPLNWNPGSPATRMSSAATALDQVERGDHGAPRTTARWAWADTYRPMHHRRRSTSGFKPLLRGKPIRRRRSGSSRARLPGIYARAFPRGPADWPTSSTASARAQPPRRRPAVLSAPTTDARLLGIPDGVDGAGPDERHLSGRFNHYLHDRGIRTPPTSTSGPSWATARWTNRKPWQIQIAANEALDNLTFVVNCNLQRLDGPVRGNGKIIQELESFFRAPAGT